MESLNLVNKKIIDILDQYRKHIQHLQQDGIEIEFPKTVSKLLKDNPDLDPLSECYLKLAMQESRKGFYNYPLDCHGVGMGEIYTRLGKKVPPEIVRLSGRLSSILGMERNALEMYYPAQGYISWHHNGHAAGWNVLFTYSENGNGYFTYRCPSTGEIVKIQDQKGWSAKVGYFPSTLNNNIEDLFWHAAYTDEPRLTIAFVVPADSDKNMWTMMRKHIETS